MAKALVSNDGSDEIIKKLLIKPHKLTSIYTKELSHFVNINTNMFFKGSALAQALY